MPVLNRVLHRVHDRDVWRERERCAFASARHEVPVHSTYYVLAISRRELPSNNSCPERLRVSIVLDSRVAVHEFEVYDQIRGLSHLLKTIVEQLVGVPLCNPDS